MLITHQGKPPRVDPSAFVAPNAAVCGDFPRARRCRSAGWRSAPPARILPPNEHEAIWRIQEPLSFPLKVYGLNCADADMVEITRRVSESLAAHADNVDT